MAAPLPPPATAPIAAPAPVEPPTIAIDFAVDRPCFTGATAGAGSLL